MNNSLVRNIIRTFSTQVGCQLVSILSGIVVARMIGPSSKGFASYALTVVSLVNVFFYGFADSVLFQFGKLKYPARAVHAVSLRIMLAALAVIIPVLLIIAALVPSQRPLAIAAIALPFAIYMQIITPFLMVRDQIALINMRTIIQTIGTAVLTVALLLFTPLRLNAVLIAWIFFYVVGAFQYSRGLQPILAATTTDAETPSGLLAAQVRFGFRAAGVAIAGFMNMRVNVIVVSIMLSATALGWYTLAMASGELLWQVSRAFIWSALGRIGSSPTDESAALVARLTRNVLAIVGLLGIVAFVAGPWLITHVYGAAFAPSGAALRWALPGLVAYAAEVALTQFMVLQMARPMAMMSIQFGSAALCAAITIATAGRYGIVAAAAATSFTYLGVTAVLAIMFVRGTGISLPQLLFIQRDDLVYYERVIDSALRTLRLRAA